MPWFEGMAPTDAKGLMLRSDPSLIRFGSESVFVGKYKDHLLESVVAMIRASKVGQRRSVHLETLFSFLMCQLCSTCPNICRLG